MTTTSRQNNLILAEDWTRIYQTFKNADFKSYDFENLRRVILTYLRENYPEDFNDYIESSEYLALIDAIAFLGQSLAFRIDLASRENFLELAERKESVLRIANMLAYNAKRNIPASGLLKFDTISTTDAVYDSNGKNLANQVIVWNDPTNANWLEQFILVLNSAMAPNVEYGRSQGTDTIQGYTTDQYRINTSTADVPLFTFNKLVAGRNMTFEVISTTFKDAEEIYEEAPVPGNQLGFIFRTDGKGAGSANTGFYLMFKQGSLELADFAVAVPTTNEKVSIDSDGINNSDVWLYGIGANGAQQDQWTKVSSLTGNNITYNSIANDVRNIYSILTKESDRIDLLFADGVYGNLPQGAFRVYYRVSNGLSYSISPADMRGITIGIPYVNKQGVGHTLTVSMGLKYTVTNSSPSEDINTIRTNAPAAYYTQNRMITGEDYNLAPLSSSQDILKIKAINRTSSGVSRNFDIIDASGRYSSVNVYADDGLVYKEEIENSLSLKYSSKIDIINFIRNSIEPIFTQADMYNYYITKFDKVLLDGNEKWVQITTDTNNSTGYFQNANITTLSLVKVGYSYTTNGLRYLEAGALVKFSPPAGKAFKNGKVVTIDETDSLQTDRLWTKVVKVTGDGTNAGRGALSNGLGPVSFSDVIPSDAIATRIIPKFVNNLPTGIESEIVNIVSNNLNFGLRYSVDDRSWKIILASNLDLVNDFSLGRAGDTSNNNLDSSWLITFVKQPNEYVIRVRGLDYVFESLEQNRFYFDANEKSYDAKNGTVAKDIIKVLGINSNSTLIAPLKQDFTFEISDSIRYDDGYQSTSGIKIKFADADDDGIIDNPDAFEQIVGVDTDLKYLFFKETVDSTGAKVFNYVDNSNNTILIRQRQTLVNISDFADGQLVYFYDANEDRVMRVSLSTNTFNLESSYRANIGRAGLKFQYVHTASISRRIDPSVSNIIDVFVLPRSYDTDFRTYLAGGATAAPTAPTSDALRTSYGTSLNAIKSISDEIIYHPVTYKVLFGSTAAIQLQAQFKVVKNPAKSINDNELKVKIISAINTFFDITNWDFGDKFYITELTTYVINQVSPDISNMIIVPRQTTQIFGSLFEIQSRADEIFVSGATVDDVEIVTAITAAEIRANVSQVITSTNG